MKKSAIYTRVSTSMQAEKDYNSCEAQKDKILSYVKSQENLEVFKEYSDPGYTGANLDRPGLQELLTDISQKKIDMVLTYKIDRLTRSSKDFYSLIEFFEKYGVSFVSVTEHFDTSSPSGRLLRNIMLTFAQFEREMIADRVKNTLFQRAEKGMLNGGTRPFGYKVANKKLVLDKRAAKAVKEIFEVFVKTGSLSKVMDFVRKTDLKKIRKTAPISVTGIAHLLRNRAYMGEMKWAGKLYPDRHEPIISKEVFEEAQRLTKEKIIKKRLYKKFLLGGLVKCAECGSTMTPCYTNKPKRRYYYYKCVKVKKEGRNACSIREVSAEKLELFIIESLSRISKDNHYIESLALRALYKEPHQKGFELRDECLKNLAAAAQKALSSFGGDLLKKSQVEKILILRKAIQTIKYSSQSLEIVIDCETSPGVARAALAAANAARRPLGERPSAPGLRPGNAAARALSDKPYPLEEKEIWNQSGKRMRRTPTSTPNPTALPCKPSSTIENSAEGGSRTHNLVRGSVFETDAYASSATSAKNWWT